MVSVQIDKNLITVKAKVLPPPMIFYGNNRSVAPSDGYVILNRVNNDLQFLLQKMEYTRYTTLYPQSSHRSSYRRSL